MNTKQLLALFSICFLGLSSTVSAQWELVSTPNHPGLDQILRKGDTLVATVKNEVFRSEDQGENWHKVFEGNTLFADPADQGIYVFANNNAYELFESTDFGLNWSYKFTLPIGGILVPGFNQDTIFVAKNSEIIRKTVNGWDTIFQISPLTGLIYDVERTGSHLWAATNVGAFHSPDFGESWIKVDSFATMLAVKGDTVLFGYCITDAYLLRTTDFGVSWETDTFSNPRFCNMDATEDEFFSSNHPLGGNFNIYSSKNGLTDWELTYEDSLGFQPSKFRKFANKLVLGSYRGLPELKNGHWVFKQFPKSTLYLSNGYKNLNYLDSTLLASIDFSGYSIDNGVTWNSSARSFMPNFIRKMPNAYIAIQHVDDANLYKCADDGFFEWKKFPLPFQPLTLTSIGDTIYMAESSISHQRMIYRSVDGGETWAITGPTLLGQLSALNGKLYQFSSDALVSSMDGGVSWNVVKNLGFQVDGNFQLSIENGDIYITHLSEKWVIRSSDGGLNYDTLSIPPLPGNNNSIWFRAIGNWNLLYYAFDTTLFVKKRDNDDWIQLSLPYPGNITPGILYNALSASDSLFFVSDQNGRIWRLNAANLGEIKGCVFKDDNKNNLQDSGEKGVHNVMVQGQLTGFYGITDSLGQYMVTINRASDLIQPVSTFPHFFYNPSEINAQLFDTTKINFALQTNDTVNDVSVQLTAAAGFRPGFGNTLYVSVSNLGTTTATGTVALVLNPLLQWTSTTPPAANISGDTIFWQLDPLEPLSAPRTFRVDVNIGFALPGILIPLKAWTEAALDAAPADNLDTLIGVIVAAYDPNDKLVRPEKILIDQVTATEVRYTIRFQNTGNIPTDFVVLRDTLANLVDVASIRMLGASHPFIWSLEKSNVLVFEFKPLHLQPASVSEHLSHGFVSFTVRLKPGATVGQAVYNTAHIYFDFNPAIVTNTAKTILTDLTGIPEHPSKTLKIFPNPATQWIHFEASGEKDQLGLLFIFGKNGQMILQQNTQQTSLDLKLQLPTGQYWVYWLVGKQAFSGNVTVLRP